LVLVTGGAGFMGSSLVKRLILAAADVTVIDNLWRGKLDNLRLQKEVVSLNCLDELDTGEIPLDVVPNVSITATCSSIVETACPSRKLRDNTQKEEFAL